MAFVPVGVRFHDDMLLEFMCLSSQFFFFCRGGGVGVSVDVWVGGACLSMCLFG